MPFKFNPFTGELDSVNEEAAVSIADTRENILSQTPNNGTFAYSTDTNQVYAYFDEWFEGSQILNARSNSADMGAIQDSNLSGYNDTSITDKLITNCSVGRNVDEKEGAIRKVFSDSLNRNIFQFYSSGQWQTILTGVNIQTDSTESIPDIEFTDFTPYRLSLITGNSDAKDTNGEARIKEMKIDMGPFSSPLVIDGGTF